MAIVWLIHTLQEVYRAFASWRAIARGTVAVCGLLVIASGCGRGHKAPAPRGDITQGGSLSYALERVAALQDGFPVTPQALQAPLPQPEQNAAPLYTRLASLVESRSIAPEIARLSSRTIPSEQQFERARLALTRCADLLSLLRQAAERPKCVFVADWSNPNSVDVIKPSTVRSFARLLRAHSIVLAHTGRPIDAVAWQTLGFRIARHIAEQNWGFTDAYFVEGSALFGLDQILLIAGNAPAVADAVRAAIEKQWMPRSLAQSLKKRAGMNAVILENLRKTGPSSIKPLMRTGSASPEPMDAHTWNAFVDENASLLLRHSRTIIAVADKPYMQSYPVIRAADASVDSDPNPQHLLLVLMDENYGYMAEQRATSVARANVTRAAAAVLAWKGRHRVLPATLAQAISPVPTDPFSGAPLGYLRRRSSFVVYSAGKTGTYTGGSRDQKPATRESVFRYPLPPALKGPIRD